jgi:hypothetical protein
LRHACQVKPAPKALSARSGGTDADLRTEEEELSARSGGTDADLRTEEEELSARSGGSDADLRTEKPARLGRAFTGRTADGRRGVGRHQYD